MPIAVETIKIPLLADNYNFKGYDYKVISDTTVHYLSNLCIFNTPSFVSLCNKSLKKLVTISISKYTYFNFVFRFM
jgi:hypothetical protein